MKIDRIRRAVEGVPHMTADQAAAMTGLILAGGIRDVLELGFRHGVSTCYIAGALDEAGGGHVTTIDLESARSASPNVDELLGALGLADVVTVHYEPTSYVWRLMKMLEEDPCPRFDLAYVDGAHDWFTDGFAFFLVDRLLRPGGRVVFDDLDWTFASSPALGSTERVAAMPADERETPQVRKVYELLVKTHPAYGEFVERDGWAMATKLASAVSGAAPVRTEVVYRDRQVGFGALLLRLAGKLRG